MKRDRVVFARTEARMLHCPKCGTPTSYPPDDPEYRYSWCTGCGFKNNDGLNKSAWNRAVMRELAEQALALRSRYATREQNDNLGTMRLWSAHAQIMDDYEWLGKNPLKVNP